MDMPCLNHLLLLIRPSPYPLSNNQPPKCFDELPLLEEEVLEDVKQKSQPEIKSAIHQHEFDTGHKAD
ncbi:unnamed protein product [Didymodactylos carnosus]|uniref:Uncharacterized protein n=1 Tax=Didymodactylos carnosus TaxID=1234261 RepID=A0A814JJX0_9BILA|nr:unnamed protein product [Didymodactylos carnosus]CAF1272312.1 unnamed protein product [Didymodactylos carnosus]CAF3809063.1 unnamed protein product [Didymodactylos carnosus]CAF4077668.1 unnamed protein product [Didymodactylos carnosus]